MVKNLPAMQETQVSTPESGRYLGEENDNPLQYSCLDNSMEQLGATGMFKGTLLCLGLWGNYFDGRWGTLEASVLEAIATPW